MGRENLSVGGCQAGRARMRDIEAIDSELRSVASVCHVARERGWALRLPDVVDALLDERLRADRVGYSP
jgi:hypothetical protein